MKVRINLSAIIAAVIFFASGCASVSTSSHKDYIPSGSVVGVISVFHDEAEIITVGTTLFNNEYEKASVADWQISKSIQNIAEDRLASDGFLTVKHIEYDHSDFLPSLDINSMTEGYLVVEERMIEKAKQIIEAHQLDAVLFVFPNQSGDPFFGTNQSIPGYGLYQRSMLGIGSRHAYINSHYLLYDAKSHLRFKAGSIKGIKKLEGSLLIGSEKLTDEQLAKSDILRVFEEGINEGGKSLYQKLKEHEYINTKIRR